MKIYIGPYVNWIGPYQIANLFRYIGCSEDRCDKIGEWLADTWVSKVTSWIHDKKQRKVKIRIDKYDSWNADETLAMIIVPVLKQLKQHQHGSALVEDKDVPAELRSTAAPPKETDWDVDENMHKRWEWVLDEIIWAFEQRIDKSWEDQFWSGEADYIYDKTDHDVGLTQITKGPKHTLKFDKKGYNAYDKRIKNGLRLFAKYYYGLWD